MFRHWASPFRWQHLFLCLAAFGHPLSVVPASGPPPWGPSRSRSCTFVKARSITTVPTQTSRISTELRTGWFGPTNRNDPLTGDLWWAANLAIARALVDDVLATVDGAEDRLVLLVTTDHESRMIATEVLKQLHRRHRSPEFCFTVPSGSHDFSSQIPAWIAASPTAVIILAGVDDAARLTLTLRNLFPLQHGSSTCQIFGSHSMGRRTFLDLAGPAAEGVRFPLLVAQDRENLALSEFIARFSAERGRTPDYTALLAYDATRLLIEAIHHAGPNRARIRLALAQASPWSGIAGPITFDGTGQNTHSTIQPAVIRDGQVRTPRVLECGSPLCSLHGLSAVEELGRSSRCREFCRPSFTSPSFTSSFYGKTRRGQR
jgi:hypothetical protein